jgi:hypothetical protein
MDEPAQTDIPQIETTSQPPPVLESPPREATASNNRVLWIVLGVLAIFVCCCFALLTSSLLAGLVASSTTQTMRGFEDFGAFGGFGQVSASRDFSRSFTVDTPAELVVDVNVGRVEVEVGRGDTLEIQGEVEAYGVSQADAEGNLAGVRLDATQSGQTVRVTGSWTEPGQGFRFQSPRITLRITVPQDTAVSITMDVGDISIEDTRGNLRIQSDVGRVQVEDVEVIDSLEITTDVAEIDYDGSLTEGAVYRLESDVGSITMDIPDDSSFRIDASSDLGTVDVDFAVVGETTQGFANKTVQGTVGENPETELILRSNVGAISVR